MLIKILGVIDILAGIIFWLSGFFKLIKFNLIPSELIFVFGILILAKGLIFIFGLSLTSFLDIISGAVLLLAIITEMPLIIISLVSLFLIQKGVLSFVN